MNDHYNQEFYNRDWVSRRYEEMEEKAGVNLLFPTHDMDGSRYVVEEDDWETSERDDAYLYSISKRLDQFCLNIDVLPF